MRCSGTRLLLLTKASSSRLTTQIKAGIVMITPNIRLADPSEFGDLLLKMFLGNIQAVEAKNERHGLNDIEAVPV
jgi:hypothetical protein